ncbi:hypothetical protein NMG60_11007764 [Bertholletia excelsa]
MEGLVQCEANYAPLTPMSFLERAAFVYGNEVSLVYGNIRYSWAETRRRCLRLASALSHVGITMGDVVAAMAPNIPALYELHFAVPMAGAVLSAFNTSLDTTTLATLLQRLEPKIIFVDYQFVKHVLNALELLSLSKAHPPPIVVIPDGGTTSLSHNDQLPPRSLDYNSLLAIGRDDFEILRPTNECLPISVNFTSGSTGNPKAAVYSHRAAYLNSLAWIFRIGMRRKPVFLWTVDMFRCNGWCLPWVVAALGGTNICIRATTEVILETISLHKVTHLCGAPAILSTIANASSSNHQPLPATVEIIVAGALPPFQTLKRVKELGFNVSHAYGMTEALGPIIVGSYDSNHDAVKCREGIHNIMVEAVDVKDPTTMVSTPADGETIGEIMFRSNTIMSGYLKNLESTQQAFRNGWYRTGDIGIRHPNGYIEMKDRVVDRIVGCGGEIISTLEVEKTLASHPAVAAAAVVGREVDGGGGSGETVCAFVRLKEGWSASVEEIVRLCGERLPEYMVPSDVVFGEFPVSSTGKVQKFVLREKARAMRKLSGSNGY